VNLSLFRSLVVVNIAAINIVVHVSVLYVDLHSCGYMPKSDIAGSKGRSVFTFSHRPSY
jgi:hypothetical protein